MNSVLLGFGMKCISGGGGLGGGICKNNKRFPNIFDVSGSINSNKQNLQQFWTIGVKNALILLPHTH